MITQYTAHQPYRVWLTTKTGYKNHLKNSPNSSENINAPWDVKDNNNYIIQNDLLFGIWYYASYAHTHTHKQIK